MVDEIKVPLLPESVNDAVISKWCIDSGALVQEGDVIAELETDKIVLEVPAPSTGLISDVRKAVGDRVEAGDVLCSISLSDQSDHVLSNQSDAESNAEGEQSTDTSIAINDSALDNESCEPVESDEHTALEKIRSNRESPSAGPSVRRMMHQHDIDPSTLQSSGMSGRVSHEDVAAHVEQSDAPSENPKQSALNSSQLGEETPFANRQERTVPMTRLRQTIAQRLLDSQRMTASLTTFNELDMTKVMDLRKRYQAEFNEKYGVKLGFMSFFTKACCRALQEFPEVNASVQGTDIVYHDYCDIGIAVSTEKGLVVPIIRDADQLEMDEIEQQILDYSGRAKSNKLTLEDLTGGTFSITNGGVFGSMLSTPILNPPQSAILGMHNIVKRPVVVDNAIQIRPMMYLALTYDHRMIDGSQAVRFLVMVKDLLEDPDRLLLQV